MRVPAKPDEISLDWLAEVLAPGAPRSLRGFRAERIGVGFGLAGVLARITLDADATLPASIVAKWSPAAKGDREARFLRDVAPRLDVRTPELLHSFPDAGEGRTLLLLEDLAPAAQGACLVGATPAEALALVRAQAALHAPFWERIDDPAVAWIRRFEHDPKVEAERFAQCLPAFMEKEGDGLPPRARRIAERLPDLIPKALEELRAAPATVIHADLHLDNVLFRADGTAVVLDWTDTARGPAAADLSRLEFECLTPETRRAERDRLVAAYLEALEGRGVRGYGADRLRRDVDRASLLSFGWAMRWVTREEGFPDAGPRVDRLVANLVRNGAAILEDM